MKKVLITGAAGNIGVSLIKYLLSEGKYEIVALDLKNDKVFNKLKKYRKRINIVYGDILDIKLMETLIKDVDIVVHLASCLPPLAEIKKGLSDIVEYHGTETLIKAINYYNSNCHLIYASSTSIYGTKEGSISNKIKIDENDYYNNAKFQTENLIKKKLENYTIIRVPLLLVDLSKDDFIYNIDKKSLIEFMTKEDAAYAFCKAIEVKNKLNHQVINIGGGENCRCEFSQLLDKITNIRGISFKCIGNRLLFSNNFYSPVLLDSDNSNKLLEYRNDSLDSYLLREKRRNKKRIFAHILSKIFKR